MDEFKKQQTAAHSKFQEDVKKTDNSKKASKVSTLSAEKGGVMSDCIIPFLLKLLQ